LVCWACGLSAASSVSEPGTEFRRLVPLLDGLPGAHREPRVSRPRPFCYRTTLNSYPRPLAAAARLTPTAVPKPGRTLPARGMLLTTTPPPAARSPGSPRRASTAGPGWYRTGPAPTPSAPDHARAAPAAARRPPWPDTDAPGWPASSGSSPDWQTASIAAP